MISDLKTDSFDFYSFDIKNLEHQRALYKLEEDPQIRRWFGNFEEYFTDTSDVVDGLNNKFLVGKDDSIIGFVVLYDSFKFFNLDYGLLPEYRGIRLNSEQTLGSKLLLETSETILRNNAEVEYLRCYIDLQNVRSISAAKRAGFIKYKEIIAGYGEYHKVREL